MCWNNGILPAWSADRHFVCMNHIYHRIKRIKSFIDENSNKPVFSNINF